MEQTLLKKGLLLNDDGSLTESGYAFDLVKEYNRKAMGKNLNKRKEWDYYAFLNETNGVCITVSNLSYLALFSLTYIDFKINKYITKTYIKLFPKGNKFILPKNSSEGNINIEERNYKFSIKHVNNERVITVIMKNFANYDAVKVSLKARETTEKSMVIATPFEKPHQFYYNQKKNLLVGEGSIEIGRRGINIPRCLGVLDWGRGIWSRDNTWYWSSLNYVDENGNNVGFNLGYGFGDTSKATENMFFFNKEAYKLNDVKFDFTEDEKGKIDFLKEVKVHSESKDINLVFTPLFNRHDETNAIIIKTNQNQVFGRFNGTITAEGKTYEIKNALGFLEKVHNVY